MGGDPFSPFGMGIFDSPFAPVPVDLAVTEPFADESLRIQDLDYLYSTLCKTVAPHWKMIQFSLPMDPFASQHIGQKGEHPYECFKQVLKLWLENTETPPTKYKILQLLRQMNFNDEADTLEKNFRSN